MKKIGILFSGLLGLFLLISCKENPVAQVPQTPAIRGSVSIPKGSGLTGSDFFVRVMEGEKAVYTGKVSSDGMFAVSGLKEDVSYSLLLTTEEPGDIKASEKDISRAGTSGYGGWLSNVSAAVAEDANIGSVKVKPLGTIKGTVTKDGAMDGYDTTVYIPGTSYLAMTDGEGNFSIFNVPQSTYTLRYISNGYMARMVDNIVLYSADDKEHPVATVTTQTLIKNAGNLMGTVTKTGSDDHSNITVMLSDGENTYTGSTKEDGSLLISGIIPGTYSATVSSGGFITQTVDDIVIEAAKNTTINPISLVANGGSIKGSVSMNDAGEKAGVLITAISSDDKYSYTTSTDTDGNFTIPNTFPGSYTLTLSKTGYAIVTKSDIRTTAGQETDAGAFSISSDYGTVGGYVVDRNGEGIENAIVKVGEIRIFTDGNGQFSKTGIPVGNHKVSISKDGYTTKALGGEITVESSKATAIGTVRLASIYGSISGKVSVNDSCSVAGIHISAVSSDGKNSYSTLTDPDGKYSLPNMAPGDYTVTAEQTGYSDSTEEVPVVADKEASVPTMALISKFGSISGKVSLEDSSDNSGVTVTLTFTADTSIVKTAVSGADGTYSINNLTEAGQYSVTLSKDGYVSNKNNVVTVVLGRNQIIYDVSLKSLASKVSGTARLAETEDFTGISILLKAKDNSVQYDATTDQQGSYVMARVNPGEYTLTVSKAGYVSKSVEGIIVESSTEKELDDVSLSVGVRSVSGTVTAELKTDHSGSLITATNLSDKEKVYSAISNSAGAYTLAGMVPGEYRIVISHTGYRTLTLPTVNVMEDSTKTLDAVEIEINRGTISGVATLEGRTSSEGIKIELLQGAAVVETRNTNAAGEYSFYVPQGNYSGVRMTMTDFRTEAVSESIALFADNYISIDNTELKATANSVFGTADVLTTDDDSNVTVIIEGHDEIPAVTTEEDGSFSFDHIPLGNYTLRFRRENCSDIIVPVSVVPSDGINLETVTITPNTATITGKVNLENGSSLAGVLVSVDMGTKTATGYTDAGGRYEIGGISVADTYTVTYSKDGWQSDSQQISPKLEKLEVREMDEVTLVDVTAPVLNSVVINNGANTAADRHVTVHFNATETGSGISKVMITEDNVFDRTVTRHDYLPSMEWELSTGNGEKTIYVKVVDAAGNESNTATAAVTLTDQKKEVSGVLTGDDLHWTEEKSPYLVTGNIMVESDKTLTIDPGVDVQFAGAYYIQVEGLIEAIGTDQKRISFYGIDAGGDTWKGINCVTNNLVLTGSEGSHAYSSGSILKFVDIQNCASGISGYAYIEGSTINTSGHALCSFRGMAKKSTLNGKLTLISAKLYGNTVSTTSLSSERSSYSSYLDGNVVSGSSIDFVYGTGNEFSVNSIYTNGAITNSRFNGGTVSTNGNFNSVSFENCTLRISDGTIMNSSFNDCTFISYKASKMNFCNMINCSTLPITTARSSTAEYDMRYNFWGYDKTREMNESGDSANLSFITDYYDDFNKTKVVYSDWVQEPFRFSGYKGAAYSIYSVTPVLSDSSTIKINDDYSVSVTGSNKISVETIIGADPTQFRVFQNINDVVGTDIIDLWMDMDAGFAEFEYNPDEHVSLYNWMIQFKDAKGNVSDIYTISIPFGYLHVLGPSGGYIIYDKGDISNGWRYLEAASADLRVVNFVPYIDETVDGYSNAPTGYVVGYYRMEDNENNLFVNGTTTYDDSDCTGTAIGTGATNTQLLVDTMGEQAYIYLDDYKSSGKTCDYAARLCDILEYTFDGVVYDDWFLPSKDELFLMYINLYKTGIGGFIDIFGFCYWSSSEVENSADNAWAEFFGDWEQGAGSRNNCYGVRPVRSF